MKPRKSINWKVLIAVAAAWMAVPAAGQVEWVDPAIGGAALLLQPTRPTAQLPNELIRVHPLKFDQLDDQISSFPLTLTSHRMGELFWLQAGKGDPAEAAWTGAVTYDQEVTKPYHYGVWLEEPGVWLEFAPGAQSGIFRLEAQEGAPTLLLANRQGGELKAEGARAVTGREDFEGMAAYLYGEFDGPVTVAEGKGKAGDRLAVRAVDGAAKVLQFRYGLSFISVEQAKANLAREIRTWNLQAVAAAGHRRWNEALGKIRVEGGTEAQRRVFYTSFYRAYERMIRITEDGRYYSNYDKKVHTDARPFYVDNWIWDTYQALEPLHTILHPAMEADKIQSYVRMYEQSGWMPSFAVLKGDHPCMTGNHAATWFADAWFKGVRNFDLAKAYEGLRKNSLEATLLPWRNGPKMELDDFYHKNGFYPALAEGEAEPYAIVHPFERRQSVAVTLENSFDDWSIAQLARELGKEEDVALFLQRAANWKNVYRAEKGFMWPRNAQGDWIEPFDPKHSGGMGHRAYFSENNAYTYNWHARHDLEGLFAAMGGPKGAEAKLDQLFREPIGKSKFAWYGVSPDSTGLVGMFVMGNEPSFAIPYLYVNMGSPWKTQKRIRMLLETWFMDNVWGIPGDEDGGGMTAFVVFSMLGFYPVTTGVPTYTLGSPVFDRATLELPGGKTFTILARNNSRENKYIQAACWNGQAMDRLWFRHADLMQGGTLELEMGPQPNTSLGTEPRTFPPARLDLNPAELAR